MNSKKYSTPRKSIPESIKMEVRMEARHCCSICGVNSPLEFHHIDENRENNSLENIILLCRNHHGEFHKGNIKKKDLEEHKKRLKTNFIRNDELDFYLKKIGWITDNLFLQKWIVINEMIGEEHNISELVKEQFEMVADNIIRTVFPIGIYIRINDILNNLANSLKRVVAVFEENPHVEYDISNKIYYLSRKWKSQAWYSPERYDELHQIDVDFERNLYDEYKNVCSHLIELQIYICENLDFNYLDRVKIKSTFFRYHSQQA